MEKLQVKQNGEEIFRKVPPTHYIVKIKSFSLLLESDQRYETADFVVGDYKWRLVLYPNGSKDVTGKDHISLFLVIPENHIPLQKETNMIANFFVLDQIRDRYLIIQDNQGKGRRFHKMTSEWGVSHFLSHHDLNDPKNSYLVDDCCVFGVELFYVQSSAKGESLNFVKEPKNGVYSWKINNFSALDKNNNVSAVFAVEGTKWKLKIFPDGDSEAAGTHLSLFLLLEGLEATPSNRKIFAKYKFKIKDQINDKHYEKTGQKWFGSSGSMLGFSKFMSLKDLKSITKGYLVDDCIIVEGIFQVISAAKYMT